MNHRSTASLLVLLAGIFAAAEPLSAQDFYQVDARGTYLRTYADNPAAPTIIPLDGLKGQNIFLQPSGFYSVASGLQPGHFWAVFAASNTLLDDNGNVNRVPSAIDIGAPLNTTAVTAPTFYGGLPMDISEDFFIGEEGMYVTVPKNARFLFVGIPDSYLADNWSPNPEELGLTVTTTTPEPSTMALLGSGLVGLVPVMRRRRKQ